MTSNLRAFARSWKSYFRDEFVRGLVQCFPPIWRVHPFREGNTRTVMMMTMFVEHCGYYMDQKLMAASAGYVRVSFVMASIDQVSEYEHLEKILMDAIYPVSGTEYPAAVCGQLRVKSLAAQHAEFLMKELNQESV